jgi:hypothetical protein
MFPVFPLLRPCIILSEFGLLHAPETRMNRGGDFSTIYKRNHFVESWKASRAGTALEKGPKIYFAPRHFF